MIDKKEHRSSKKILRELRVGIANKMHVDFNRDSQRSFVERAIKKHPQFSIDTD